MTALTSAPSDARSLPGNASHRARLDHGPRAVCRKVDRNVLCAPMPAREQPPGHALAHECIGKVVPPVAVDVQEPEAHAFLAEAELLDHPAAGGVLRPDV